MDPRASADLLERMVQRRDRDKTAAPGHAQVSSLCKREGLGLARARAGPVGVAVAPPTWEPQDTGGWVAYRVPTTAATAVASMARRAPMGRSALRALQAPLRA